MIPSRVLPAWLRDDQDLRRAIAAFYEAQKPTAALCHGVCALLDVELSDGSSLIAGKTIIGFANVEEDVTDTAVGQRVQPFRIEDEARQRGANYVQAGLFKAFAIRDNQLITGQQHYSGTEVARLAAVRAGGASHDSGADRGTRHHAPSAARPAGQGDRRGAAPSMTAMDITIHSTFKRLGLARRTEVLRNG